MSPSRDAIAERAAYRCEYCRAPAAMFNFPFEVEHVIPESRGGGDSAENLALSCRACNVFKGAAIRATDPVTGAEVDLFNPRQNRWEDHFHFDPRIAEVTGITPTGRATVGRLRLNLAAQLRARREWARLGQYP